ncbi:Proline-rich receptor-like protein kinase PERK12 [Triticum urartu]|uniref:non-specific serine/threonine protein kinase n=1 Tax=Triticum urartu TaxID=4572 RepID=M7ZZZ9_TRIUA|nr:Proline-rich receptor-like protein kinase PERK12 [Triticum urartu]
MGTRAKPRPSKKARLDRAAEEDAVPEPGTRIGHLGWAVKKGAVMLSSATYYYDPCISNIDYGEGHVMVLHRITMTHGLVASDGLLKDMSRLLTMPARPEEPLVFHDQKYVDLLCNLNPAGFLAVRIQWEETFPSTMRRLRAIDATVAWCINSAIARGNDIAVAAITSESDDLTTGVATTIATKEPSTSHPNPFTSPQCEVSHETSRRSGAGGSRDPFSCLTVAAFEHYAGLQASSWHVAEPSRSGRREGEPTVSGTSGESLGDRGKKRRPPMRKRGTMVVPARAPDSYPPSNGPAASPSDTNSYEFTGYKSCFMYDELAGITGGFSAANVIGEGGFGKVYMGTLGDGRRVAVKQLKAGGGQGEKELRAEVDIISRIHHRHLVTLVGYCVTENHRLLVYEFVSNDTLEHHLHGEGLPARPLLVDALETDDFREIADPALECRYSKIEMRRMVEAAAACIRHTVTKRPRMVQVWRSLDVDGGSTDLTNGVKLGHSTAYDSGQYSADIELFRRMGFEADLDTAEYGLSDGGLVPGGNSGQQLDGEAHQINQLGSPAGRYAGRARSLLLD